MDTFTADCYCPKCKKITPHRIYFCGLHGEAPDLFAQAGELCVRVTHVEGKGRHRKTFFCSMYREYMLPVRDWNALTMLGHTDYPTEYSTVKVEEDDDDED